MLNIDNTSFLIVDIQEKLVNMLREDTITHKAFRLLKAADILNVPCIITEQYPKGLGSTIPALKAAAPEQTAYFEKTAFSALQEEGFKGLLSEFGRNNIVVCGIEAHVCVYQTVADLVSEGYNVEAVKDIIASRNESELNNGIEKMRHVGAGITSLEILLFELLKTSKHPDFKEIQSLIK